jgi:hypothetical protein
MGKINLDSVKVWFKNNFKNKNIPLWLRILNLILISPILIWPLLLFVSVFLLDNPQNILTTLLAIFLIVTYPIYLLSIAYFSFKFYNKNIVFAILLPLIPIMLFLYFVFPKLVDNIG